MGIDWKSTFRHARVRRETARQIAERMGVPVKDVYANASRHKHRFRRKADPLDELLEERTGESMDGLTRHIPRAAKG